MKYATVKPADSTGKPPVLLVLHGYGANEYDLIPIAEAVAPNFLTISFRAPIELMQGGYAWYHLTQTATGLHPDDLSRHESEDMLVNNLAAIVEQEGGDPTRVVLMGFSQGAAMCYSLLITYNLKNYGISPLASINLSGYIPRDVLPALKEKRFDNFPFFMSHGEYDELIPSMAMDEADRLLSAQGASVTTSLHEAGHGVLPETMEELAKWVSKLRI